MPRLPIDFSKTQMYKIVCNDLNITDIYIGHTTHWRERKWSHRSRCNNEKDKKYNLKIYQTIRDNGGWDNWDMVLIEDYPCTNNLEACKRERELMEEYNAKMNMINSYATKEEKKKQIKEWNEENKNDIKEKRREIYQLNKEEINQKKREIYQLNKEAITQKIREKYQLNKEEAIKKKEKYHLNKEAFNQQRREKYKLKKLSLNTL